MTPRERAMRTATAVFLSASGPAGIWDPLVNALERAELLELELAETNTRRAEDRAHHIALEAATKALRSRGVNPVTWSALVRAMSASSGQRELPLNTQAG